MRVDDICRRSLMLYPSLYQTRMQVYNQLFCVIGNGYEWQDGELYGEIAESEFFDEGVTEYNMTDADAVKYVIRREFRLISGGRPAHVNNFIQEEIIREVTEVLRWKEKMDDYSIPNNTDSPYHFYMLSEYSLLCCLPDNITLDWFLAAKRMYFSLKEHPENWMESYRSSYDEWLPKIKERLVELQDKFNLLKDL